MSFALCKTPPAPPNLSATGTTDSGPFPSRGVALVDCDNFYVSCERVFNPALVGQAVVVLSNNDGCIISRSREAKAAGIKMGAPYHQALPYLRAAGAVTLSSNYALYGDMSRRVATVLRDFSPQVEIYSIDEAFLNLDGVTREPLDIYARRIRETIRRWVGIPVSVGIGATKTLAKIAAERAKESPSADGMLILADTDCDRALRETAVAAVWGIGPQYRNWLVSEGITTAAQLRDIDDAVIRKRAGIVGLRTVLELRGVRSIPFGSSFASARKGITCSRSLGRPTDNLAELRQAAATYAARAGQKLRRDGSAARLMSVSLATNPFQKKRPQYCNSALVVFPSPTDCDRDLVYHAIKAMERIYRTGYAFHKAGVTLSELSPVSQMQIDIFASRDREADMRLNAALDKVNARLGSGAIQYAATGLRRPWKMRSQFRSPRYTTVWGELPVAELTVAHQVNSA